VPFFHAHSRPCKSFRKTSKKLQDFLRPYALRSIDWMARVTQETKVGPILAHSSRRDKMSATTAGL
jgi:hypothetical protein